MRRRQRAGTEDLIWPHSSIRCLHLTPYFGKLSEREEGSQSEQEEKQQTQVHTSVTTTTICDDPTTICDRRGPIRFAQQRRHVDASAQTELLQIFLLLYF